MEVNKEFEKENRFIEWLFEEYKNGLSKSKELFRVIENYSQQQGEVYCREFSVEDFGTLSDLKRQRTTFGANNENNQRKQDGAGNNRKIELSLTDFGEIRFSKKGYAKKQFKFQHENFPPNNETHNTAHQDALHWARLDTVEVGDQRLIFSNGDWYVAEKFSDFSNNYQVVEKISDNEFDKIFKEIKENGRSGRIKSIQEGFVEYDKLNKPSYSIKARESSSDSFEIGHGRENSEMVRMVETESQRRERTGSYGTRDSSSGSLYREGEDLEFFQKDSNQIKLTTNKKPTKLDDIRFSKKSFGEQVDDVLNGVDTSNTHLKVMDTPILLQEAGLPNLPILMTAKHVKTITSTEGNANVNYHGLDVNIIKNLPNYISNPVMIADSFTRDDSVVIITEAIDSKNRPVIAAIMLNGKGKLDEKHINANIMTSAYGKDNFQVFLNKIADSNAVIYWNKKKSQDLSVSLGIQFSNAITSLDSNTIIRKAKAFVNTDLKNSSNKPSFSRKANPTYTLSNGQVKKRLADYTKLIAVYSWHETLATNFYI